jgi:tetratricopeptide (TPR) repeat protein
MTSKKAKTPEKSDLNFSEPVQPENNTSFSGPYDQDPDYQLFLEAYQIGNWEQSKLLLDGLILRNPDEKLLNDYFKDIEVQLSLREISLKHTEETKKKKVRSTESLTFFSIALGLFVVVLFTTIFVIVSKVGSSQKKLHDADQLSSLSNQAQQLLLSGQPVPVFAIVEQIRAIDPNYASIIDLTTQAQLISELEIKYKNALELTNQKNYPDALVLYQEIEKERPGLWDVLRQIKQVQDLIEIESLFKQAQAAYKNGNWTEVIQGYEAALLIDPQLDDGIMKEQLLNGYLRSIIQMLENDSSSIQEIEKAEEYYRKAVAMIPQSRAFASERENLQEVSSSLLELKYSQISKELLQDPNQTVSSISKAVSYLSKATNLNPKNGQLQIDLTNAQLYQIGFQNFIEMNWDPAIDNLSRLVEMDKNYANGNANILLYEAYAARGRQYYSVGLYLDARKNFESAEIIAWERPDNIFKLFDVQIQLGNTLGKLTDFKGAISYYQYAFTEIDVYSLPTQDTTFSKLYYSAEELALQSDNQLTYEKYVEAIANISDIYLVNKMEIQDGMCLAFFADLNKSTIAAIQNINSLAKNVTITFGQELLVPTLN